MGAGHFDSSPTNLGWNKRYQLTSLLTQKVSATTYLNLGYTYFDNGQIQQITNNLDSLKSEKFTYDELARLLTAQRGPDANIQRKYVYEYDRWGNRWKQDLQIGVASGYDIELSFNSSTNRVNTADYVYDDGSPNGSGNLTSKGGGTSYSYDLENFMLSAGASTYKYDAKGRRKRKTVGGAVTHYFYSGSVVVSEKQGSSWTDYVFFGSQRIAKQTGATASTATYIHTDHLGSTRVCTNSSGNSAGTCEYEPFGELPVGAACSVPTNYRYAGMEWDSESGLYHTWFRPVG